MTDPMIVAADRYIESLLLECLVAAEIDGYTPEDAENCDDGELGCENCPFK